MTKTVFFIGLMFLLPSCEDEATQIGQDLLTGTDNISTLFTDTLTLNTSTVLLDSVVSSSANHLLVGRYIDPVFGMVEAKSFFQITNIDSLANTKNAILDSVVLSLGYKYYYGDTLKSQSISVHRVTEKIGQNTGTLSKRLLESLDTRNIYYGTDQLNYDPTPLGSTGNFKPRPVLMRNKTNPEFDSVYSSLNIKLDPAFGRELLNLEGTKAGQGLVDFKEYFKGMVLVPGPSDNASILGFEPNNTPSTVALKPSYVGLYYHSKDKIDTLRTFFLVSFTTNEAFNNRFNQIKTDRSATVLSPLNKPNAKLNPQGSNAEIFVQSSTGIAAKVEIPYLKNLSKDGKVAINKVELILTPTNVLGSNFPTTALSLVNVNPTDTSKPLRTSTGELYGITAEGGTSAQLALYNVKTKEYSFNITSYFQNILTGLVPNNGFIISSFPDYRINRLILNNKSVKLRVFYTKLGK